MWIEVFEAAERDTEELLSRLLFMFNNVKSHREQKAAYDSKIIKYLEAWGLNRTDNPDTYLKNINRIGLHVKSNLDDMRKYLGNKNPDLSIACLIELGNLIRYLEEVMSLRWPGSENPETKNDYLFEIVDLLRLTSNKLGELISQIDNLDKSDKSLINERNTRNPWSIYATKP